MRPNDIALGQIDRINLLASVADIGKRLQNTVNKTPGALKSADRELLERLYSQIHEFGGQIDRVCKAVELREIDGFSQAELRAIGNACGTLSFKLATRLEQDRAARMIGKRNTQLKRAA